MVCDTSPNYLSLTFSHFSILIIIHLCLVYTTLNFFLICNDIKTFAMYSIVSLVRCSSIITYVCIQWTNQSWDDIYVSDYICRRFSIFLDATTEHWFNDNDENHYNKKATYCMEKKSSNNDEKIWSNPKRWSYMDNVKYIRFIHK